MSALERLHNRIDLDNIPFTDRATRLLLFLRNNEISVRLAERWAKWEREIGHYRQRPPIIERMRILNSDGTPVTMTPDTYPHAAGLLTDLGRFEWIFVDPETLMLRLPEGRYSLFFIVHCERGTTDRRGATFRGKRNVAYTTNALIESNTAAQISQEHFEVKVTLRATQNQALLLNITPRLAYNRAITSPDIELQASRQRWQAWFDAAPPVADVYRDQYEYAWWVMRIGLLNTRYFFTREACVPSKIHYVGVWHWDQFFHALAYRHMDRRLAEDQIRIVLDHQREDGMLPDAIHDEGLVTRLTAPVEADVTKPPLAAWTALKLYEVSGNRDFLEEVYEPLCRWHAWWTTHSRSQDDVLCEYRHPFSSGLDDSPLWDDGMPVVAPDLNTYLCVQAESLAKIADLIGLKDDVERWEAVADQFAAAMLGRLWDETEGYFRALHLGSPVRVLTPFNLLPLWVGRYPEAVTNRLLAHLQNPDEFWARFPLPTVALNDPKFDGQQMWRGPTWVNINYLFIEALTRLGHHNLAQELRTRTLALIMQQGDIYEYYDPLTGEHPPKSAPIFGWTSAVFIDLAITETRATAAEKQHGD